MTNPRKERTMRGRALWSTLAMLAVLIGAGTSTARATVGFAASHVSCGQTITTDTKLDSDLVNCPSNGVVIGADNITLDLNGHVIDGDGTEFSACPPDEPCDVGVVALEHEGVTIKGGSVREFGVGVLVVGATDSRVTRLALSNNLFLGLIVADSSRSEVDRVAASENGLTTDQAGIGVFDSGELMITRNDVFTNGDIGMFIVGLEDSRIEANSLSSNPEAGIILEGSGNEFTHNRVSNGQDAVIVFGDANIVARNWLSGTGSCPGECGFGVSLEGGTGNVIEDNSVVRFHQAGIRVASFDPEVPTVGNIVRGNLTERSAVDGVLVESTAVDTLLERNVAIGAGDDGIDVDSAATTLTRNLALRNGDLGIEAVEGVRDRGRNEARANGDPRQCTHIACG
jgi:parallel beta-helix repeat protein